MAHGHEGEPGADGTKEAGRNLGGISRERAAHTPGPWGIAAFHAGEDDIDIYDDAGVIVARAIGSRDTPNQGSDETWDNAKLITAAPALLGALKWALPLLVSYYSPNGATEAQRRHFASRLLAAQTAIEAAS